MIHQIEHNIHSIYDYMWFSVVRKTENNVMDSIYINLFLSRNKVSIKNLQRTSHANI